MPSRDYTVSPCWWTNTIDFKEIMLLHLHLKSKKMVLVLVAGVELRACDSIISLILALWVQGSSVFSLGARKVEKPFGMLMGTTYVVIGRMLLIRNKCQPSASASFEEKGLSDPGVWALLCFEFAWELFLSADQKWCAVVPEWIKCKTMVDNWSLEVREGEKWFCIIAKMYFCSQVRACEDVRACEEVVFPLQYFKMTCNKIQRTLCVWCASIYFILPCVSLFHYKITMCSNDSLGSTNTCHST